MASDSSQKSVVANKSVKRGVFWLLINLWNISSECTAIRGNPNVSVLKWSPGIISYWDYGNLASTTDAVSMYEENGKIIYYKVARHVTNLHLVCNASYPVKWTHKHYDRTSVFSIRTRTFRESGDNIYDASQYKFSAILELQTMYSKTTGRYLCQSTRIPEVQTDVYVYVLGYAPPFLVYAGRTMVVKSEDNKTISVPCIVSTPDTHVELYKRNGYDYTLVPRSPYVDWDPQKGFTLTMSQMNDTFGDYKCVVVGEDEEDDYALFSAVPGMAV
ncbi:unnamed protein product, partial [Allacma fusca]